MLWRPGIHLHRVAKSLDSDDGLTNVTLRKVYSAWDRALLTPNDPGHFGMSI